MLRNVQDQGVDISTHIDRFAIPSVPNEYRQFLRPRTASMSSHEKPLPYEDGSLYILLSLLPGQCDRWHWSLFVMISNPYGQLYQVVSTHSAPCQGPSSSSRDIGCKGRWIFCQDMTPVIPDERAVILALQIAKELAEEDVAVLDEVVNATRVGAVGEWSESWGEEFSCRVWVKEVLANLRMVAETGEVVVVQQNSDIDGLESEALSLARGCMRSGERRLLVSKIFDT